PFSSLVLVRVEAVDRAVARQSAQALARLARGQARAYPGIDVLGPAVAPLPKLVGRYRVQVVMRGRDRAAFRAFLRDHHLSWKTPAGVRRIVDVDPRSMM
ncbi:MAG: primosomal protein N', partial [Deltaproteobacteria bacterium]|nr:primosomal protein N' [Deltaproteobacteria bacterium]